MYNESPVVEVFFQHVNKVIDSLPSYSFEIVVVNDGSRDDTLVKLLKQQKKQSNLRVVSLSRNFGHEPAVCAGLKVASGDAVIPMDADLQDPPELIKQLLEKFEEGFEVVNARRASRKEDSFLKRFTALQFYKMVGKMSGKVKIPSNVGHFRLISRRVADEVNALSEKNRVFRIEVPFVGHKTTEVLFDRPKRVGGVTHYNYKSMFKLAFDAFTSSTSAPLMWPLNFTVLLGLIWGVSVVSELVLFILQTNAVINLPGIYSTWLIINVFTLLFLVLMFFVSILSLYVSRIFSETQNRPFFVIDKIYEVGK
jgi:glycosyltransferase involved in cell wall biosynthesis